MLHEAVGPEGRIIGVDLSSAMLAKAQERVVRARFSNVDLIQADMASYDIPLGIAGAVATYTLEMIPAYDVVIRRIAAVLPIGGRLASHGLKHPERWPDWLVHMGIWITKPFGVSRAYESFRPWVSIRHHFQEVEHRECLLGAAYLSVGESKNTT